MGGIKASILLIQVEYRMDFDGYHFGIKYPDIFHRELTPLWLVTTTEALGFRPPEIASEPFVWCELGCGPGFGLVVAAASNPRGHFIGVDINPEHMALAKDLALRVGLCNVEFHLADFATWSERSELTQCDFIVSHGVFSWISAEKQQAVLKIIERCLKPMGLCYLGYMSHPGASPMMSIQQMLLGYDDGSPNGMARGFEVLSALAAGGAGQFVEVPSLREQLGRWQEQPSGYLAHEFLNRHWRPLHAAEVIEAMQSVGCDYLGSAAPIENIDAVSLPEGVQEVIARMENPLLREVAKDMARNQSQRLDIYQRGRQAMTSAEHRLALLKKVWTLLPTAPAPEAIQLETRIGPVGGIKEVFAPLFEQLLRGPRSFAGLLDLKPFRGNGGLLNQSLQMMMWAGWAHPLQTREGEKECSVLNREICHGRLLRGRDFDALAIPGIGSGLPVSRIEMAFHLALAEFPDISGHALHDTVRRTLSSDEITDDEFADIERRVLPWWRRLSVLPNIGQ